MCFKSSFWSLIILLLAVAGVCGSVDVLALGERANIADSEQEAALAMRLGELRDIYNEGDAH
jgi:hypothetical protein